MPDDVAHLILTQRYGLRQAFGAATSALHGTPKPAAKVDRVAAEVGHPREELGAARADGRGALPGFEHDLLATEWQHAYGHGETLSAIGSIGDLERRTADLERQIAG